MKENEYEYEYDIVSIAQGKEGDSQLCAIAGYWGA